MEKRAAKVTYFFPELVERRNDRQVKGMLMFLCVGWMSANISTLQGDDDINILRLMLVALSSSGQKKSIKAAFETQLENAADKICIAMSVKSSQLVCGFPSQE